MNVPYNGALGAIDNRVGQACWIVEICFQTPEAVIAAWPLPEQ